MKKKGLCDSGVDAPNGFFKCHQVLNFIDNNNDNIREVEEDEEAEGASPMILNQVKSNGCLNSFMKHH